MTFKNIKKKLAVIILAAGKGTRMKTEIPKVLNKLNNKPLLYHVLETSKSVTPEKTIVIVGYKSEDIIKKFSNFNVEFSYQNEQLGTAHAALQAENNLKDFRGNILILSGDVPLLTPETLEKLIYEHNILDSKITILTSKLKSPKGYGRIIRKNDYVTEIIEDKDLKESQRNIKEINAGIYCIDKDFLFDNIKNIKNLNAQKEYYITDIVNMAIKQNIKVNAICIKDSNEICGINTIDELKRLETILNDRNN